MTAKGLLVHPELGVVYPDGPTVYETAGKCARPNGSSSSEEEKEAEDLFQKAENQELMSFLCILDDLRDVIIGKGEDPVT